ncbi:MAG: hypothetical protein E4H26_09250, partial [Flavobacteriales bacterium]
MKIKKMHRNRSMGRPVLFRAFILAAFLFINMALFGQTATVEVQSPAAAEGGSTDGSFRFLLDINPGFT